MGGNLEERLLNPSWADALFLGFNPQAMQLVNSILGMKHTREDRAFQRQQADREYELRKGQFERQNKEAAQRQADADTNLQIGLAEAGAIKGNAEIEDALTKALGAPTDPRSLITTRKGDYYLLRQKEQRQKYLDQKRAEKGLENEATFEKERQKQTLTTTPIDIPGVGPVNVPNASIANVRRIILDMGRKKFSAHSFLKDNQGNVTFVGIDAETNEPIKIPLGKIGSSKSEPQSSGSTGGIKGVTLNQFETAKANALKYFQMAETEKDSKKKSLLRQRAENEMGKMASFHQALMSTGLYDDNSAGDWKGLKPKATSTRKPESGRVQTATPQRNAINRKQYLKLVRTYGKAEADARLKERGITVQ